MEFLRIVMEQTDPWAPMLVSLFLGLMLALSVGGAIHHDSDASGLTVVATWVRRAAIIVFMTALPVFALVLFVVAVYQFGYDGGQEYWLIWFDILLNSLRDLWWIAVPFFALPFFVKMLILRVVRPRISAAWRNWGVMQSGDALSDIRTEVNKLKAKNFLPSNYYKEDEFFFGLDEKNIPLYAPLSVYVKTHIKALGPSQTGKGVFLGVELDQAIWRGWGAWFIDQKPDDNIVHIMSESCERNGRPAMVVCDLTGSRETGYHPFKNGTRRERRERITKVLGLNDSGTDADHYKRNARRVLDMLMPHWDGTLSHLAELIQYPPNSLTSSEKNLVDSFGGNIESSLVEMQFIDALEPLGEGLNIEKELLAGSVVYIKSDLQDDVIRRAANCLLEEVIQVVRRISLSSTPHKYVQLTIDEARFMMTDTLANSLATVLSKHLLMTLAYQAREDPLNLTDKTLNGDSIKNGIETNTQITIVHRATEKETAQWISDSTGEAQKSITKMERVERNQGGAEEWTGERSIGQQAENFVHTNVILALPPRVAVLIIPNVLSTVMYSCWVPYKHAHPLSHYVALQQSQKDAQGSPAAVPSSTVPAVPAPIEASPEDMIGDDPFAELDQQPDDTIPFDQEEDPFADADDIPVAAEQLPQADDGPSGLTPEQQAMIDAAANNLFASSGEKKNKTMKQEKKSPSGQGQDVDLSSLDNVDGI
ncbi:TPA: TraM recognition domain-containing protein [Pseudomonas aeruginosa]|nr:TraM recognition domain-containing protein [Pseudomonas aeruginosa]